MNRRDDCDGSYQSRSDDDESDGDDDGGDDASMLGDSWSKKDLLNRFTMGMVHTLEGMETVADILLRPSTPCTAKDVSAWEMANGLRLPPDIKAFYRSTNGLGLAWTAVMGEEVLPVGYSQVNTLEHLKKMPSSDLPDDVLSYFRSVTVEQSLDQAQRRKHMQHKAFYLASCGTVRPAADLCGSSQRSAAASHASQPKHSTSPAQRNKAAQDPSQSSATLAAHSASSGAVVALVFTAPHPTVWLKDRAHTWHLLARSFTEYYRLMTLHLGIIGWQYALTSLGPPPSTAHWLFAFAPHRMLSEEEWVEHHSLLHSIHPKTIHKLQQHTHQLLLEGAKGSDGATGKSTSAATVQSQRHGALKRDHLSRGRLPPRNSDFGTSSSASTYQSSTGSAHSPTRAGHSGRTNATVNPLSSTATRRPSSETNARKRNSSPPAFSFSSTSTSASSSASHKRSGKPSTSSKRITRTRSAHPLSSPGAHRNKSSRRGVQRSAIDRGGARNQGDELDETDAFRSRVDVHDILKQLGKRDRSQHQRSNAPDTRSSLALSVKPDPSLAPSLSSSSSKTQHNSRPHATTKTTKRSNTFRKQVPPQGDDGLQPASTKRG